MWRVGFKHQSPPNPYIRLGYNPSEEFSLRGISLSRRKLEKESVPIPEHKHCPVCGKAISSAYQYCSGKCEEVEAKKRREVERVRLVWYIVLIVFALILFLPTILAYLGIRL